MPWTLIYSPKALHQLRGLPNPVQKRIITKLEGITEDPFLHVQRLKDSPLYSIRVGEYRVILTIFTKKVIICVVKVGHRKNVYKNV